MLKRLDDMINFQNCVDRLKTMNLSNIKKIADILAAVGVLISLLYLGIQVADNNKFLRSQAHYNALELNINPMVAVISDDELAELLVSCDRGIANLTEGQIRQCDFYYFVLFNTWEYIYYQNRLKMRQ